ncbi:MAG: YlxR family protein [Candidatus Gastranaerophilales bacterium]|nr:YlxR family protein [Candidatus Gastranaerophilales bacterium]MCM1072965.1 YlxR family protein [Bacteroides sp.]
MIKITKEFQTGKLVLNPDSKTFGRSAYLCYNHTCIEKALKKNKLNRVLKTSEDVKGLLIDEQFKS